MRQIIVDGYNVIRADPRLQALEQVSLQHARETLVRTLASSPRLVNDRLMVVFDGREGQRSHIQRQRMGRVDLVFSRRGQTADDVIVEQASALATSGRVVVVSNDVQVRENCRAAGCEVSASENLLDQMPGRIRPRQSEGEDEYRPGTLSTEKKGNARRSSRRARRQRDIRF